MTPWFASFIISLGKLYILGYLLTFSIILSLLGLNRIQCQLENPFGNDWDDINVKSMMSDHMYIDSFQL